MPKHDTTTPSSGAKPHPIEITVNTSDTCAVRLSMQTSTATSGPMIADAPTKDRARPGRPNVGQLDRLSVGSADGRTREFGPLNRAGTVVSLAMSSSALVPGGGGSSAGKALLRDHDLDCAGVGLL